MEFFGNCAAEKQLVWDFNNELKRVQSDPEKVKDVLGRFSSTDAVFHGFHPVNTLNGIDEAAASHYVPFCRSFPDWERRNDIFMASTFKGSTWISSTGYYLASFMKEYLGIPASGKIIHLRFGEFVRVEDGIIAEWICIYDLIDLMRQTGVRVLPESLGVEGLFQGPATQDGIQKGLSDPGDAKKSIDLVESMIFQGLMAYDGKTLESMGQERYWDSEMMWYGPSGIGTTRGLSGFQRDHQIAFLTAFPDRKGGNHRARTAEGMYAASTGWPSLTAVHAGGGFLGIPPTGKRITMRVMDWWRREGDLLKENWVFIDLPDLLLQMGYDILQRAAVLYGRNHQ